MIRQIIILIQDRLRAKQERRTMPRDKAYRLTKNQMLRKLFNLPPGVRATDSDDICAKRYAAVQELKLMQQKAKVK